MICNLRKVAAGGDGSLGPRPTADTWAGTEVAAISVTTCSVYLAKGPLNLTSHTSLGIFP
ncbi:hypothetical protein DAEQUDRAFT_727953 [Daedalea quercina L-15889]|uniref:Uncharacterized protein n=1 Tax=Daedalea quercina L-15889 TaxID=1314783 RepID=A0A165PM89_9APHY|nr:hypothetical protein DAEQUDRAFT_727953 [Daedalea quercina L-15889]